MVREGSIYRLSGFGFGGRKPIGENFFDFFSFFALPPLENWSSSLRFGLAL